MKIVYEMKGIFKRFNSSHEKSNESRITLSKLCGNLQAIATRRGYRHLSRVQKEFGFDFLPEKTFENLLSTTEGKSTLLANNILKPHFKLINVDEIDYTYTFESSSDNFVINIESDDPQLPYWSGDICDGNYSLVINSDKRHNIFDPIIDEALSILKSIDPIEILEAARKSPSSFPIALKLANSKNVTIWQSLNEVDQDVQEAVLNLNQDNYSTTFINVTDLIRRYKRRYHALDSSQLSSFSFVQSLASNTRFIIGRNKHRQALTKIIESAEKFLIIASFRLEDKSIIDLIARKGKTLPQGVWILTDLGNDVLDKIDTQLQGKIEHEDEYFESNQKKRECLHLLAKAGVFIRSGLFHVKFCITEREAYLGSCNLTGGSLERNREAGIIWQNTEEQLNLIEHFKHLWKEKAQAEIVLSPQGIRSIGLTNSKSITPVTGFLNYFDYMADLEENLIKFSKDPHGKIYIYGRSINPNFPQQKILANLSNITHIFYGWRNYSNLQATLIKHLHAKVVVLGEQVAYIGTQDLFVSINPAHDLTYKTTNSAEIKSILELLKDSH